MSFCRQQNIEDKHLSSSEHLCLLGGWTDLGHGVSTSDECSRLNLERDETQVQFLTAS